MAKFEVTEITEIRRTVLVSANDARSAVNKVEKNIQDVFVTRESRENHYIAERIKEENIEPLVEGDIINE